MSKKDNPSKKHIQDNQATTANQEVRRGQLLG